MIVVVPEVGAEAAAGGAVEAGHVGGGEAGVGLRIAECGTRVLFEAGGGGRRGIPAFLLVAFTDEAVTAGSDDTKKRFTLNFAMSIVS